MSIMLSDTFVNFFGSSAAKETALFLGVNEKPSATGKRISLRTGVHFLNLNRGLMHVLTYVLDDEELRCKAAT